MNAKKLISVIVPCYNEEDVLPLFYDEIQKVSAQMQQDHPELTFEYLFIDDGSKDRTLSLLRGMAREDSRVRFISFSRNFGKESGIYAGLSNAKGDYCVVMDADLQHPPAFLPEMYEAVASGCYDCATTRRVSREGESKVRSWFARLFYKIMNKISQTEIVDGAQDFRFMTRQMVDAVLSMSEKNRFSKGIFSWVGFRVKYMEYENVERAAGTTSWSFWGLFRYSIEGILGYSTFPLAVSTILGALLSAAGLIALIAALICNHAAGEAAGAGTVIAALILFSGIQLISVGVLGMYLGKMYLEVKDRPVYLVRETEQNFEQFPEPEEYMSLPDKMSAKQAVKIPAKSKQEDGALSQAKRLKQETDREFDAIVSAAMQDEDVQAEEYDDEEVYAEDDAYAQPAEEAADEESAEELTEAYEEAYEEETPAPIEEEAEEEKPSAKAQEADTPAKEKFEVSIDYDSIDDYDEESYDDQTADEADDDAEYEEESYDEADGEYDDEPYDEEYEDEAYEEEYDDEPAPVRSQRSTEDGSFGGKFAGFWESLKQKIAALKDKLNSDKTLDAYEAAIDEADPQSDDYDDYDADYDEEYDDYDGEYDDDAYYEEDDDEGTEH